VLGGLFSVRGKADNCGGRCPATAMNKWPPIMFQEIFGIVRFTHGPTAPPFDLAKVAEHGLEAANYKNKWIH
jgi:hypothetical protein